MEKGQKKKIDSNFMTWMENNDFVISLRRGLMLCIPFFIIGSFCVLMTSFPAAGYQAWIRAVARGAVYQVILWVYNASMGSVTLFVILAVSYSYACQADEEEPGFYMLTSFVSYMVFVQEGDGGASYAVFGATWLFTGILVTLLSCTAFRKIRAGYGRRIKNKYQMGLDADFRNTVEAIMPIVCVVLLWALLRCVLAFLGVGTNLHNFGSRLLVRLFETVGTGGFGAAVYIFFSQILWFFGIHGSDMLHIVSTEVFEAALTEGVASGQVPIFTKTFLDAFTLMGGSGSTLCLLAALALRNNKKDRTLFKAAILPAVFNINEIVLFGLPVVLNPIMIIPFVLVPLAQLLVAALSMYFGLVPVASVQVGWTTPVLLSGYLCTGSVAGGILQAVLLVMGAMIYTPFIKLSEERSEKVFRQGIEKLRDEMVACEERGETINFRKGSKEKRECARTLMRDLREAIDNGEIWTYYQPQITNQNSVYGVEALLRWKHPVAGFLYPPMVIELARQNDMLDDFGISLIDRAAQDLEYLSKKRNLMHMAVNILPAQMESETFCGRVEEILEKYDFGDCILCLEITEQMALSTSGAVPERMARLKRAGIVFHMDDFGMGHSSMQYLQSNEFEAVKLDGSLVKQVAENERSRNIIAGIRQMALSLHYEVIAEYVETEEQRRILEELGCYIYQGYLYSPAVPLKELEKFFEKF